MSTLELRLTVADGPLTAQRDLLVIAGPAITVGDFVRETSGFSGLAPTTGDSLWCERRRLAISAATLLANAGIRWGDRLVLGPAPTEDRTIDDAVAAVITGGPCAGRRVALSAGDLAAGRGPECEIQLADPSLSRRHLEVRVQGSTVLVRDAGSSNGSAVSGSELGDRRWRPVMSHEHVHIGRTSIRFAREPRGIDRDAAQRGRVSFNRMPRVAHPAVAQQIDVAPPPDAPRRARLPLVPALVSMLAGVVMFLLLDSVAMLAFSALGPIMLLSSFVSDWRSGRRSYRREATAFRERLATAQGQLERARDRERRARLAAAPDAADVSSRALSRRPDLWERRPGDADFLALRVGIANLPPHTTVVLREGGDPVLRAEGERVLASNGTISSVPLVLDLHALRTVGLCGERTRVEALTRWLVVQAATLHAPADVVICAAVADSAAARWEWLKWLPHADAARELGDLSSIVVCGSLDGRRLLEHIRVLQDRRREEGRVRDGGGARPSQPQILLVLDEGLPLDRALVGAVLAAAADTAVSVLWLGHKPRDLPGGCCAILELDASIATLDATIVESGHVDRAVSADGVDTDVAEHVARALAPVRDTGAASGAREIPRRAGLLEILGLPVPGADELARRWAEDDGRLLATLGAAAGGPLSLDLGTQGPHALIVGTTGSGKSELLRTLVASLAVAYPPDRVSFLLIDYKGSAAFAPCAAFPHVVDVVSNLDEHLAERALVALRAEMKRREQLLAAARVKDLAELMRLDRAMAPPALVIAVDEFAQLRAEVPGFVDGVVDIARRGRSLGIHMVLAAQSLQDAFTPSIRANTNIRIALRVAEDGDSSSVIAARDAARIPSGDAFRGRGFVRTGHGELQEFQAAYVSGRSTGEDDTALAFVPFGLDAGEQPGEAQFEPAADTDTDLTALAHAAAAAHAALGIAAPPAPWLPVLPASLPFERLARAGDGGVTIGLVDDPDRQRQYGLELELDAAGHVALFGGGGAGKSSALRTTALALARAGTPDELHIYALESASRDLQVLSGLPHCGAVVTCGDGERVERLLALLVRTIEERTLACTQARVTSFAQLAERPPRIVVLLDDIDAFAKEHDQPGAANPRDLLARILATGRAAGVHVVMTAERRAALPAAIATHVGQRLVLAMPTPEDLLAFGLSAAAIRGVELTPGHGFTQAGLEFQIAVPGGEPGEQIEALRTAAGNLRERHPRASVPPIGSLGEQVPRDALPRARGIESVAIGIGGLQLAPASVELVDLHFLVIGPYRSGRTTALETLAAGLSAGSQPPEMRLLAPRPTRLASLDIWTAAARGATACGELAAALLDEVQSRAASGAAAAPLVVVVDDAGDLVEAATHARLERVVRLGRDTNVRIVAAAETGSARAIGVPWLRELRKEGHGLLLAPDLPGDGDLLGAALPRRVQGGFPLGRGFLVRGGRHSLVQVAR